jgi:phospholipase C
MPSLTGRWARWIAGAVMISAGALAAVTPPSLANAQDHTGGDEAPTTTPIKHLVVLFQENVPFDHYFGTYPNATNPPGEPRFVPAKGTPSVNGLTPALLTYNPNLANPKRLDRSDPVTCGSNHDYIAEQKAFDHGLMDRFVQETGSRSAGCEQSHTTHFGKTGTDYDSGNEAFQHYKSTSSSTVSSGRRAGKTPR